MNADEFLRRHLLWSISPDDIVRAVQSLLA
jgi:hypothetical protein